MAYNDQHQNNLRMRHFFFPGLLYFAIEAVLGVIILITLNLASIGQSILSNSVDQTNPVDFASSGINNIWHWINQLQIFMNVSIFILWALAGVLGYLLIFGLIKIIYGFIYSAEELAKRAEKQAGAGVLLWFFGLNDFFKNLIVKVTGTILLFISTFILFGYASALLKIGISDANNEILSLLYSIMVAILAMRFLVSGIGLLVPGFRRWYYA